MSRLTIRSTNDTPAMWYRFITDAEPEGRNVESTDEIEQRDDGNWVVQGVTGPTGRDTYIFDADGVRDCGAYLIEDYQGRPVSQWDFTEQLVDPSRFEMVWNGELVDPEEICLDENGDGDNEDGNGDGDGEDGNGDYGGHEPVDLSGVKNRLDTHATILDDLSARVDELDDRTSESRGRIQRLYDWLGGGLS